MGSIDIPQFVRDEMKKKAQGGGTPPPTDTIAVPDFLKKKVSGNAAPTGTENISPSTSPLESKSPFETDPNYLLKKIGEQPAVQEAEKPQRPVTINADRLGKSFLDRDIDAKYDLSLSNPEIFKPENKFSLSNVYNESAQQRFDAERDLAKADIKSSPEKLAAYSVSRIGELNKTIDGAKNRIKKTAATPTFGADVGAAKNKALQDDREVLANAEVHKEKLKQALLPEAAKMVIDKALENPETFSPSEVGKQILSIADPDYSFLIKKGESGEPVQTGDELGGSISPSNARETRPIYKSYIERLGLDVAKNVLQQRPDSEEKTKLLSQIDSYESDFDLRNEELTAQRVREKLGVYFYQKGKSGWLGYSTNNIDKAIDDPELGLSDAEKKVAKDYVLPQESRMGLMTDIPGSGFLRSGKESFIQGLMSVPKSIGSLTGLRDEAQLANETLNAESEESGQRKPGQNSTMMSQLATLNDKEQKEGLSEDEKQEQTQLEKFVNVRTGWSKLKDNIGDLTGQVAAIALTTKGIGGVGKGLLAAGEEGGMASLLSNRALASKVAGNILTNENVGLTLTGYLSSYDSYRKQALTLMPGEDNELNRKAYAGTMAAVEGLSERIFNDVKVLKGFTEKIAPTVAELTSKVLNKEVTSEFAKQELRSAIGNELRVFGKEFFTSEFQESFEEGIVDVADGIAQSTFGGQDFDIAKTGKQALNTFVTTALGSPLVAGMAARGRLKENNSERAFFKSALVDMAINPNEYLQTVEELKATGEITEKEAAEKNELIKSANQFLKDLPTDVKKVDYPEASAYILHRLNEKILGVKASKTQDDIAKKGYEDEIKRSQEIRKGIIGGDIGVTADLVEVTDNEKKADELGITDSKTLSNDELIGTPFKTQGLPPQGGYVVAPEERLTDDNEILAFQNATVSGKKEFIDLFIDRAKPKTSMQALKEQSLDAPNSLLESLNKDQDAVTDIIALNDEAAINAGIQKWTDAITNETHTPEEADAHIKLLEEGLAKKQEQAKAPSPKQTPTELKVGGKVQWDVYGNEGNSEWTVKEHTKTRGGEDAVVLTQERPFYDESGKHVMGTKTTEHTVKLSEFSKEPTDKQTPTVSEPLKDMGLIPTKDLQEVGETKGEIKTISEHDLKNGDKVTANIRGEKVEGTVTDVGVHHGKIVIDITDSKGNERFVYGHQIENIEAGKKQIDNLTQQQKDRVNELINKDEVSAEEIKELGVLNDIRDGKIENPQKQLPQSSNPPSKTVSEVGDGGEKKSGVSVIMPADNKSTGTTTVIKPEGESVPPPPTGEPPKTSIGAFSEQPPFTLIKSNLKRARVRVGLDPFDGESVSNVDAATKAQRTIEDWEEKGIYNAEIKKIIDDVTENEKISDEGQNILAQHIADLLVTKSNIKDKSSSEYDNVLKQLNTAVEAGDLMRSAAGRVLGRKLSMRGSSVDGVMDVTDIELNMMHDRNTDILTDQQKEEAQKMWDDLAKAREEFNAHIAEKEAELAKKQADANFKKERKIAPPKDKTTSEKFAEQRKGLREKLEAARKEHQDFLKSQGIQKMGIGSFTTKEAKIISQIITSYAHEGVVKFADAVNNFITEFGDLYENIDESDLNRIYSGEFNEKKETKNEITERLYDWRSEAKLLTKIEKLEQGEEPKTEEKRRRKNEELSKLREQLKNHPITQATEERKRIEKRIDDLKQRVKDLDAGNVPEKRDKKKAEVNEEIKDLQDQIKEHPTTKAAENAEQLKKLQQRLDDLDAGNEPQKQTKEKKEVSDEVAALQKEIKQHELTRLVAAKESLKNRIAKGEEKLRNKDYTIPEKKEAVQLDDEGLKLQDKLMHVENELQLRRLIDEHEAMSDKDKRINKLYELINLPRTGMTILDFSAVLRQGIMTAAGHPQLAFGKEGAFWKMFKSTFNQKDYDRWFFELRKNDPRYDLMLKTRLAISDNLSHQMTEREEMMMSTLPEKLGDKVFGKNFNPVRFSERAYTMFLNKMRVDIFNQFANSMEDRGLTYKSNPKAYENMASYINSATGRGNLHPKLENISPLLSGLLFSPRLIASRLNMLTFLPQLAWRKNVPKEAINSYFRSVTGMLAAGASVLLLASLDPDNDVELDPRSSDFGKIKNKNTRWDVWGGFQPYMRAMAQIATGERKSTSTGKIRDLSVDGPYKETWLSILGNTGRSKLSPVAAAFVDITTHEDIIGNKLVWQSKGGKKEISALKYLSEHIFPLLITGTVEAVKDQGVKGVFTVGVPSLFGVGTQTYQTPPPKKHKH